VAPHETFSSLLRGAAPLLALAPMQDVTTLEFMRAIARYGGPEVSYRHKFD
jgi:tRNA-dihydrouridine synthase